MPYCVKCENYVGNLKDKFGSLCPKCGTPTVDYDRWKRDSLTRSYRELRVGGKQEKGV